MKALYRRYRPKTLDDVVGQEQVTGPLKNAIKSNKLAHAYLFVGPRGTGKTSVARILAHEINGFKYELEDDYLDIIEIDAASNTGVDNIRDLREKAIIAPVEGKYKIYIIDEVHMLTRSAFNALLKTLEEPPAHVIFIMATTDAHKVPVTITSRSQTLTFSLADPSTMFDHLKKIAKSEKINIDDEALKIIVRRGGGSYRDSLSLLDQVSTLSSDKITVEILNHAFGLPPDEKIDGILNAYAAGDTAKIRENLIALDNSSVKPDVIADNLISHILERPDNIFLNLLDKLTEVSRASYPNVRLLLALTAPQAVASANFAMPTITSTTTPVAASAPKPAPSPTKPAKSTDTPKTPEPTKPELTPAETPAEPTSEPSAKQPSEPNPAETLKAPTSADFDPNNFQAQILQNLEAKEELGILQYVRKSKIEVTNERVIVYAGGKLAKRLIDKKRSLIAELMPTGYELDIREETKQSDAELASIAELMGGGEEVTINE